MAVDVSIIIVNWNAKHLLPRCIDAVGREAAASGLSCETIVVDNDSSDGSLEMLRTEYPQVTLIETGTNGGMAAGNNVGMKHAAGRMLLLLNSDAFLEPGSLRTMVDAIDAGSRIGLVSPQLLNEDRSIQRSVRGFPTLWRIATEFLYFRKLAPRSSLFNTYYRGDFDHDRPADVDWVMGACMMVSRAAVDEIGLMNEAYFMYAEEIDWQFRMHAARLRIRFEPAAEVVHLGGGSSSRSWGALYPRQVSSIVQYMATCHGYDAARRVQRLISWSMRLRSGVYSIAALIPGTHTARHRDRSRAFAAAGTAVRQLDLAGVADPVIPSWLVKQEARSAPIDR